MFCKAEIPTVYHKRSAKVTIVSMDNGGVKNKKLVASKVMKSASDTGWLLGSTQEVIGMLQDILILGKDTTRCKFKEYVLPNPVV